MESEDIKTATKRAGKIVMDERLISEIPVEEFDAIIDAYIERETQDTGELDAPLFYEALKEFLGGSATSEATEIEGEIVNNRLVVNLPEDLESDVDMRDVAILFGNRRIVVKLKNDNVYPAAH